MAKIKGNRQWGSNRWKEQPLRVAVSTCTCGNKYVKSRDGQTRCVQCINQGK